MQKDTILRKGWRFHLGDIPTHLPTAKGPAYISSKTERMKFGPAACGYRDMKTFYNVFHQHMGISPGRFRRQYE